MNFFRAQDHARKQTRWLILLFVLAVICLILITTLCVAVFVWITDPAWVGGTRAASNLNQLAHTFGLDKLLWISLIICSSVGVATLATWQELRQGGRVVAESLGGRLLQGSSNDLKQRQLLNVVEEMALASGMPVPPVYLLAQENGINAFAAGVNLSDAVIGVTQGCLDALNREQLQGVIAHEFSHILNGDMRMNQQLVAMLSGLMIINTIGRGFFESSRNSRHHYSTRGDRRDSGGALMLLGLALIVIGWLGQFFGALIRSAVSRQREFLADASSVQFTRNPEGIGGALQVIGGYRDTSSIRHHRAHELGHFFFCAAYERSLSDLFATHPPLNERIRRVLPSWKGSYLQADVENIEPRPIHDNPGPRLNADGSIEFVPAGAAALAAAAQTTVRQATPSSLNMQLNTHPNPPKRDFAALHRQAREPASACLLVLALLMHRDAALRPQQMRLLKNVSSDELNVLNALLSPLQQLTHDDYLPLLELSIPALKELSNTQYQRLREQMSLLIHADNKVELFEWALFEIVRQYCDLHFGLRQPVIAHYKTLASIQPHFVCVLTKLVQLGSINAENRQRAFDAGCRSAGIPLQTLPSDKLCTSARFTHCARELAKAWPLLKPRLLKGLIHAAKSDSLITSEERQLITAISVMMDCPLVGLSMEG